MKTLLLKSSLWELAWFTVGRRLELIPTYRLPPRYGDHHGDFRRILKSLFTRARQGISVHLG